MKEAQKPCGVRELNDKRKSIREKATQKYRRGKEKDGKEWEQID